MRIFGIIAIAVVGLALAAFAVVKRTEPTASAEDCREWLDSTQATFLPATALAPNTTRVWTGLQIVASKGGLPAFTTTLVVQVPSDYPGVDRLVGLQVKTVHPPGPSGATYNRDQIDLNGILTRALSIPLTSVQNLTRSLDHRPSISVGDGIVTIVVEPPANNELDALLPTADNAVIPLWEVRTSGREVSVDLGAGSQPRSAATEWTGAVCTVGVQLLHVRPSPIELSPDRASFRIPANQAGSVRVRLRQATWIHLWLLTGRKRAAIALWNNLAGLLIVSSAFFVARKVVATTLPSRETEKAFAQRAANMRQARDRFRIAILPPLALLLTGVVAAVLFMTGSSQPSGGQLRQAVVAFGFGLFLLAGDFLWARRNGCRWGRQRPVLLLLSAGFGALLVTPVAGRIDDHLPTLSGRPIVTDARLGAVAVPWVFASFVMGIALLLVALAPSSSFSRLPPRTRRPLWWLATMTAGVLCVGAWMRSAYLSSPIWTRAPFELQPARFADGLLNDLKGAFWSFPLSLVSPAATVLPLISAVGLIGVLHAIGSGTGVRFVWEDGSVWIMWSLLLLFALIVGGDEGELFGARLPLALVASLILLRLVLRRQLRHDLEKIRAKNARNSFADLVDDDRRKQWLWRAEEAAVVEVRYTTAFQRYEQGDQTLAQYQETKEKLRRDQEYLETGECEEGKPPPVELVRGGARLLRIPDGISVRRFALAIGPGNDWWSAGELAVRTGALLALIPIAYYLYVVLTSRVEIAWTGHDAFGGFSVVAGLLHEVAFWLTAAFVLGCLFPYLPGNNGVQKGAALAGVYAAAQGLAALVFYQENDPVWLVRSFELLLYLMALGFWLDVKCLQAHDLEWRSVLKLYGVGRISTVVSYGTPVAGVVGTVIAQLSSGETRDAVIQLAKGLETFLSFP